MKRCLISIVGPTAIGKSKLGIKIAEEFNGEIVNADSRQIYIFMDIGTSKPSIKDRQKVKHHLIDIIYPDQLYSVANYKNDASAAIVDIMSRNKIPILVGGSGQYIWCILENWQIPFVEPDIIFRKEMEERAQKYGIDSLYKELKQIDPASAVKISPRNLRRIIRALEIYQKTGLRPSAVKMKRGVDYPVIIIGLTSERKYLYEIIDKRVDNMIKEGFIDEVKNLKNMGYYQDLASMSSIGYRQIYEYLNNLIGLEEAITNIKYETHRFARSQYSWFKINDERIKWFFVNDEYEDKIEYTVKEFLERI